MPSRSRTSATASSSPVPWIEKKTGTVRLQLLPGLDHALGHDVGAREGAAEIHDQALHARIGQHEVERDLGLGVGLAADLQEVRRAAAEMVDRRPWSSWSGPAPFASSADIAVELDELEPGLRAAPFELGQPVGRRGARRSPAGARRRRRRATNLQSSATMRPSLSSASGLISTSSASFSRIDRRRAARGSPRRRPRPRRGRAPSTWRAHRARRSPEAESTTWRRSASGRSTATSSMSMPPSVENSTSGLRFATSISTAA